MLWKWWGKVTDDKEPTTHRDKTRIYPRPLISGDSWDSWDSCTITRLQEPETEQATRPSTQASRLVRWLVITP